MAIRFLTTVFSRREEPALEKELSPPLQAIVREALAHARAFNTDGIGERTYTVLLKDHYSRERVRERKTPLDRELCEAETRIVTGLPQDAFLLLEHTKELRWDDRVEVIHNAIDRLAGSIREQESKEAFRISMHTLMAPALLRGYFLEEISLPLSEHAANGERRLQEVFGISESAKTNVIHMVKTVFHKWKRGDALNDEEEKYAPLCEKITNEIERQEEQCRKKERGAIPVLSQLHGEVVQAAVSNFCTAFREERVDEPIIHQLMAHAPFPLGKAYSLYGDIVKRPPSLEQTYNELEVSPEDRPATTLVLDRFIEEARNTPVFKKREVLILLLIKMNDRNSDAREEMERDHIDFVNQIKGEIWQLISTESGEGRVLDEEKSRGLFPDHFHGMHGDFIWEHRFSNPIVAEAIGKVIGSLS